MKALIVFALVAIVLTLGSAGALMLRRGRTQEAQDRSMARALALRVALSIALFLFILLAWSLGWIRPTGIPIAS